MALLATQTRAIELAQEDEMGGVNNVTIVGNLGHDPEVRYGTSGNAYSQIRLAVTEQVKVKGGEGYEDKTEWVRITIFGKTAENVAQYMSKGRQMYVEGRLETSTYEKEGQTHYATDVIARRVVFLEGGGKPEGGQRSERPKAAKKENVGILEDDDLPF